MDDFEPDPVTASLADMFSIEDVPSDEEEDASLLLKLPTKKPSILARFCKGVTKIFKRKPPRASTAVAIDDSSL